LDDAIVHVERLNGNTGKPDRLLGYQVNFGGFFLIEVLAEFKTKSEPSDLGA
jgi:hypothetical protein